MLELKNIYKTYSSKNGVTHRALENVSLKFKRKGLVFILGKSGSGKSTLLNMIGGLDDFDRGEIIFNHHSFASFTEKDYTYYRNTCIGFVFQEFNLLDNLNVGENVGLALELQGQKDINNKVNDILAKIEISDLKNRKINELTGGQKQRVAIARALIKNPKIILADEPTGSLDSETSNEIIKILESLAKDRLVIIVTHNKEIAYQYGQRIIEIKDGFVLKDLERKENNESHIKKTTLLSSNLMVVPKGEKVNQDNINDLNVTISEKRQDYYLLIEQDKNRVMSLYPNVKEVILDDEKGSFKPFTYNNEEEIKEEKIAAKLPFSSGINLGFKNLRKRRFKLFFTILLAILAVLLTGTASNFTNYNLTSAVAKSIEKDSGQDLEVSSSFAVNDADYTFQNSEINYLNSLNRTIAYSYDIDLSYSFLAINSGVDKLIKNDKLFLNEKFNGFFVCDTITDFGYKGDFFKVIYEKEDLTESDKETGVYISSIVAETIVKYSQFDDTYGIRYASIADLINTTARVSGVSYPIIGIYDIDENESLYQHFKALHESEYSSLLYKEYLNISESILLRLVVNESFLEHYKNQFSSFNLKVATTNLNKVAQYGDAIRSLDDIDLDYSEIYFFDDSITKENYQEKIKSFSNNQILVGKNLFASMTTKKFNKNDLETMKNYVTRYNSANHSINLAKTGSNLSEKEIYQSIENVQIMGVVVSNKIESGKSLDTTLKGIYIVDDLYSATIDSYYRPSKAFIKMENNENYETMIQTLYDNGFTIDNNFVSYFLNFVNTIAKYSTLINIVSIVWFIIVAILLYSFMSSSIKEGAYSIGVLKALGASIHDIYKIYAVEALIIGICATVLGVIGYYFGGLLVNYIITDLFYTFYFPIFIFRFDSVVTMVLSTFIILFIALSIPLAKIKNIKPIDVMNNGN